MLAPRNVIELQAQFHALEQSVDRARSALACAFSSAEEFEAAVISARRACGAFTPWYGTQIRLVLFATAVAAMAAFAVIIF
jgi:hypothetical protein